MKKLSHIYLIIGLIFSISCQNSVDTIADAKWKVYSLSPFIYNFSLDQKPNLNFSIAFASLLNFFNPTDSATKFKIL